MSSSSSPKTTLQSPSERGSGVFKRLLAVDGVKRARQEGKLIARYCASGLKGQAQRAVDRILRKERVHFLHVGKTGGTAIKYALSPVTKSASRRILLHAHDFSLSDVPRGEKLFFFLRDPLARFVSGFFSRQRQGAPRYSIPWTPSEEIAFARFSSPNQLALALCSSNEGERDNAVHAMRSIQHVRDSYWKWLNSKAYLELRAGDILFIGLQQNLITEFELLKSKLGLPASVLLPSDDMTAHKTPADRNKSLQNAAIENLRAWYAKDYECIDVCSQISTERSLGGLIVGGCLSVLQFWFGVAIPLCTFVFDLPEG